MRRARRSQSSSGSSSEAAVASERGMGDLSSGAEGEDSDEQSSKALETDD
jgi:hypothetical protein